MNIQEELIKALLNKESKEEALYALFEFLKNKIPFEKIHCFHIDGINKIKTAFVTYTLNEIIPQHVSPLTIDPFIIGNEKYYTKRKSIYINNYIDSPDDKFFDVQKKFFEQFPYEVASTLSFLINIDRENHTSLSCTAVSSQKNAFTEEHADIFEQVRPYISELCTELYGNSPSPHVFAASYGIIPTNSIDLLNNCPNLKQTLKFIKYVAPYNSTVLINGATGVGKELVAESIHQLSPRKSKPFIRVNCGAIPESLIESELFGHEKGAFTHAINTRKGYFEQANNGTIYLDEVGELSMNAQTRLLRALENKEIHRVGGDRNIRLDIRVIVATHKNLEEMVKNKTFREDLYYRLNGFPIEIPSLSQRKGDIPILAEYFYKYFVQEFKLENPPIMSYNNFKILLDYPWHGNVRELRTTIERTVLIAAGEKHKELDFSFLSSNTKNNKQDLNTDLIYNTLEKTKGKIQGKDGAAALLDMHPSTLRSKMRVLGIPFGRKSNYK